MQEEEAWHAARVVEAGAEVPSQLDAMGEHSQAYPYQIFRNLFPHGGDFQDDGYTTEEQKLVNETRKILRDPDIAITATVARVPVVGGHSEAVNVELLEEFEIEDVSVCFVVSEEVSVGSVFSEVVSVGSVFSEDGSVGSEVVTREA